MDTQYLVGQNISRFSGPGRNDFFRQVLQGEELVGINQSFDTMALPTWAQ